MQEILLVEMEKTKRITPGEGSFNKSMKEGKIWIFRQDWMEPRLD